MHQSVTKLCPHLSVAPSHLLTWVHFSLFKPLKYFYTVQQYFGYLSYGCMTFLDSKLTGIFCFDLTLTEMSSVLVYIDRSFLYFDCNLAGAFSIVLCLGVGIPCFYCTLAGASCIVGYCALVWTSLVLIVLWQGHPVLQVIVHWYGHPLF